NRSSVTKLELRNIGPLRNRDDYGIFMAFGLVVPREPRPQFARFRANSRVSLRIIVDCLIENLGGDHVFFDTLAVTFERRLNHEFQKSGHSRRVDEYRAGQNLAQFRPDSALVSGGHFPFYSKSFGRLYNRTGTLI